MFAHFCIVQKIKIWLNLQNLALFDFNELYFVGSVSVSQHIQIGNIFGCLFGCSSINDDYICSPPFPVVSRISKCCWMHFSEFCKSLHEQIALDKTCGPKSCPFSVRDGHLYKTYLIVSDSVSECWVSFRKQQPVKWSSFFKYRGTPVSGIEGLSFLDDSVVANVPKICGKICGAD